MSTFEKGRRVLRILALAALVVGATAALAATQASAAFHHPSITASFGSDGTEGSSIGTLDQLKFNQGSQRLYAYGREPSSIYGFSAPNAGTHSPLGGNFPFSVPEGGGDPDIAGDDVDGNIYYVSEGTQALYGFDSTGTALGGNFPVPSGGGDACGNAVDSAGNVWLSYYGPDTVKKFDATGALLPESINVGATGKPCHIEIDRSNDDLYVADYGGGVYRYTAESGYTSHALIDPQTADALAVDSTSHTIYTTHSDHVNAYNSSGALLEQFGTGAHSYAGVAVDEVSGVVYVSDRNGAKIRVMPGVVVPDVTTGEPIGNDVVTGTIDPAGGGNVTSCKVEFGPTEEYTGEVGCSPAPPYTGVQGITATLPGLEGEKTYHYRVVAANANGTNVGADQTITPHFVNNLHTDPAGPLTRTCATLNGSYVGEGLDTHYYFDWGTSTAYGNQTAAPPGVDAGSGVGPQAASFELCGLEPGHTYHYRIVARNATGTSVAADQPFTTVTAVEYLSTDPASNVLATTATLNGSFQGNGEGTHYFFEWGTTTSYGNVTAAPPGVDAGSGTGPMSLHFDLSGLNPVTTYHYRIIASNGVGQTEGQDRSFKTATSVPLTREFATQVHSESALLNAEINPGGLPTVFHFEFGTADCASNPCERTPEASEISVGSSGNYTSQSIHIEGLSASTTYHFRVVASNSLGISGYDATFTTFPFLPEFADPCANTLARQQTGAALLLDCRAYELVSSSDAGGYDVESDLVPGQAPFAGYPDATDPARVLYGVHNGAIPGVAGHPTNKGVDPYVATRGSGGWSTTYIGVAADNPFASTPFSSVPSGADAGLGTFAFGGPGSCSPCFGGGYTGIPVRMAEGSLVQGMAGSLDPGPAAKADGHIGRNISADGTHLIFGSTSQFEPDGNSNGDVSIYDRDLTSGETHVVSKDPGGANLPCIQGPGKCNAANGNSDGISELDVSSDGSRILLGQKVATDADGNNYWHLFMNIDDASKSIDLTPGTTSGALYAGMTSDGTSVFFTTADTLAAGDTDSSPDLYEAEVGDTGATLIRISTGEEGAGNTDSCDPASGRGGAQAHWNAVGSSLNCGTVAIGGQGGVAVGTGSVYFLSPEMLNGGGNGTADQPNLYVAPPGSPPHFIARLHTDDAAVLDAVADSEVRRTADFQVTPSGEFAVFGSTSSLTGYTNAGHTEVYRYAADAQQFACASCNPTNAGASGDATLASNGLSITDQGQVVFNSRDALALIERDGDTFRGPREASSYQDLIWAKERLREAAGLRR